MARYYLGVYFFGPAANSTGYNNIGHRVLGLRMPHNYAAAIQCNSVTNLEVRNNLISLTQGTTVFGANASVNGIIAVNGSAAITDNTVDVVVGAGSGTGIGINCASATNLVANNTVSNITGAASTSWGIYFGTGTGCFATGNKSANAPNGLNMSADGTTAGRYQSNLTSNIAGTRFANGSDSELNY